MIQPLLVTELRLSTTYFTADTYNSSEPPCVTTPPPDLVDPTSLLSFNSLEISAARSFAPGANSRRSISGCDEDPLPLLLPAAAPELKERPP